MHAYLISFQVAIGSTGFSFSNSIIQAERPPTSHEIRALEDQVRERHSARRDDVGVVALSVSLLGD